MLANLQLLLEKAREEASALKRENSQLKDELNAANRLIIRLEKQVGNYKKE